MSSEIPLLKPYLCEQAKGGNLNEKNIATGDGRFSADSDLWYLQGPVSSKQHEQSSEKASKNPREERSEVAGEDSFELLLKPEGARHRPLRAAPHEELPLLPHGLLHHDDIEAVEPDKGDGAPGGRGFPVRAA